MAKKNLIIGGFTGYNYNQLKPWVESICEVMPDAAKVLIVGEASAETKSILINKGFSLFDMAKANIPVHVLRFLSIYDFLRTRWQDYNYVVTTDVKDVYFQTDPFQFLKDRGIGLGGMPNLVAGSESMLYKDEPWGNENLNQSYGPYIFDQFKDNEIYNVGTIGGKSEYVKDMVFNIFTNAVNRPIQICDQAVYNILINTQPYKSQTLFCKQADAWACQAGTTVDPSKIQAFRPFLTEAEPVWKDGLMRTGLNTFLDNNIIYGTPPGTPFCIVHQYDRVPEWKRFVAQKFKQEESEPTSTPTSEAKTEDYFVYRT
jgi:hypothetical protein